MEISTEKVNGPYIYIYILSIYRYLVKERVTIKYSNSKYLRARDRGMGEERGE